MALDYNRIPRLMRESVIVVRRDEAIRVQFPSARQDEQPRESFFRFATDAREVLDEAAEFQMQPTFSWALETNEVRGYGTDEPLSGQLPTYEVVDVQQQRTSVTVLLSFSKDFNDDKTAQELRGI